jgi:hypothetical protein
MKTTKYNITFRDSKNDSDVVYIKCSLNGDILCQQHPNKRGENCMSVCLFGFPKQELDIALLNPLKWASMNLQSDYEHARYLARILIDENLTSYTNHHT